MDAEKNSIRHPDENLLTAFAEQAVMPQERQMVLEHLSSCARCREILFLMQEAEPVPAVVVEKETESGKLVLWKRPLLWGYGVAILVIALGSLSLIHRVDKDKHSSIMASVNALQSRSSVVTPPLLQPSDEKKQAPAPIPNKQGRTPTTAVPKSLQQVRAKAASTANDKAGSAVTEEAAVPVSPLVFSGMPPPVQDAPKPQSGSLMNRSFVTANSPVRSQSDAPQSTPAQRPAIDAPVNRGPLPADSMAATMTDDRLMLRAGATGGFQPQAVFRVEDGKLLRCERVSNCVVRPLPDRREASAVVSRRSVALVLDKTGSLFLSNNSGESWQPIPIQWAGQARNLQAAGEKEYFVGRASVLTPAIKNEGTLSGVGSLATVPRQRMTVPIFALTNDKGETWHSLDWGKTWQKSEIENK